MTKLQYRIHYNIIKAFYIIKIPLNYADLSNDLTGANIRRPIYKIQNIVYISTFVNLHCYTCKLSEFTYCLEL